MENETPNSTPDDMAAEVLKKGSKMSIILGILCIIAGLMAIVSPFVAGTATTVFVGCLILASGIFELVGVFRADNWKAGSLAFLSGDASQALRDAAADWIKHQRRKTPPAWLSGRSIHPTLRA